MSGCRAPLLAGLILLVMAGRAQAQDERALGLVMGAPLQVGLLWQATERVAVRPGMSAIRSSSDIGSSIAAAGYTSESTTIHWSTGVTLLLYLTDPADLRTYVAPRYGLSRSTITSRSNLSGLLPGVSPDLLPDNLIGGETRNTQITHEGGVAFGVQHAIGTRFRVFGEVGISFTSSSTTSGTTSAESSGSGAATMGGVGVVWMF